MAALPSPVHPPVATKEAVVWRRGVQLDFSPILDTALEAFSERGYHGTTVRDIAHRVGVTVPALYYHHQNKKSILYGLLDASIDQLIAVCSAAVRAADDDVERRFCNFVEALVLYMAHSTKLASLDPEIRSLGPDKRATYATKRRAIEQLMVMVITDGKDAGLFHVTSAASTGRALLGMIQSIARWFNPNGDGSAEAVARDYLDIAIHTVGAHHSRSTQARP